MLPNVTGATWAAHEVDQTIMNPGDHWFWDASHRYLVAPQLWQFWLDTVGQGSNWILNVPPSRSGSIPENFAAEMAKLGAALNASFGRPVASGTQAMRASCASSAVTLEIPAGAAVDAVELREDLTAGQAIAAYTLELQQGGDWVPIKGVHGVTVGPQLLDTIPPLHGPATLRFRCLSAAPSAAQVRLDSLAAFHLQPPAGYRRPQTTKWALQTLYSPVAKDETPCATRSSSAHAAEVAAANRSSCSAYLKKPGARYAYVRDEHCCLSPPSGATPHGLVPLYLQFNAANNDHMLSPNKSFSFEGKAYETHGPECYGLPASSTDAKTAALEIWWSAERKDLWSLGSDASRAQAAALGYVRVEGNAARLPTEC